VEVEEVERGETLLRTGQEKFYGSLVKVM